MALKLVTSPEVDALSLAQAKSYLRVGHSDDDADVTMLVQAAQSWLASGLNRALVPTTFDLTLDRFPDRELRLPVAPLAGVTWIRYYDVDGVQQTLDPTLYYVDDQSEPGWVMPQGSDADWPDVLDAANSVTVRFVAGYPVSSESESGGSGATVTSSAPPELLLAVRMLVTHWYENRGPTTNLNAQFEVPLSVERLVHDHRIFL